MPTTNHKRQRITRGRRIQPPQYIKDNTISRGFILHRKQRLYYYVLEPDVVPDLIPFACYLPETKTIVISSDVQVKLRPSIALLQYLIFNDCRQAPNPHTRSSMRLLDNTPPDERPELLNFLKMYYKKLVEYYGADKHTENPYQRAVFRCNNTLQSGKALNLLF